MSAQIDGYAAVNVNTVDRRRHHDGEEVESASATERRSDTFGVDSWNRWSLPQRSTSTVGSRRRASRRARIAEYGRALTASATRRSSGLGSVSEALAAVFGAHAVSTQSRGSEPL